MRPRFPFLREALNFSFHALNANKVRTALTALGLLIGNASVILVVTISITSRDLILDKIRGIGSNLVSPSTTAARWTRPATTRTSSSSATWMRCGVNSARGLSQPRRY
jgi:hypothetical protein